MDTKIEREEKSQPKHRAKKSSKKSNVKKTVAIAVCAVVIAFAAAIVTLLASVPQDVIAAGVYADNINLSGMTKEEAVQAISGHQFFTVENITVAAEGKSYTIPTSSIALGVNAEETAQKAFEIGKSGNKFSDAIDVLVMRFSDKQTDIVPSVDEGALNNLLYEFGKEIHGELVEHNVEIGDETVKVIPGTTGASTDYTKAKEEIFNAISNGRYSNISITMNKQAPADVDVESLSQKIYVEAKNAEFATSAKSAEVVSHVVGIELDKADAQTKVASIKEGGEPVEINIIKTMPDVTKDMLEAKLFNATLGTYSTKYSASNKNRSANLALASDKMNGTVLAPGETFSYNDVVGKRTAANGFKNAPVYENGKSVDGIGGGVCQVSTTLYSAVLHADLKVVSRQNHSLPVSYVPLGQDATVVDGSIDFKFQNDTNYPVKIVSSVNKGVITISLLGTQRDVERTVKLEHKTLSSTAPTVKEIKNPSLPAGTTKVVSKGKTGYVVESTKIVYENGNEVSRVSLGKSKYKMVPEEVEVGTAAANAPAPAETTVSAPASQPVSEPVVQQQVPQTPEKTTAPAQSQTAPEKTTVPEKPSQPVQTSSTLSEIAEDIRENAQ